MERVTHDKLEPEEALREEWNALERASLAAPGGFAGAVDVRCDVPSLGHGF
jgi:hypothetical protein